MKVTGVVACVGLAALTLLADSGPNHRVQQTPPIKLGTSGSNINDINAQYCCTGTLGSLVEKGGVQYILSNNHVLARTNLASPGEAIIHRGYVDSGCTTTTTVAHLSEKVNIGTSNNKVDAAIAQVVGGMVDPSGNILDIGTLGAGYVEPVVNKKVKKSGRTTGLTTGRVYSTNVTVNVQYQQGCGVGPTFVAQFVDQFLITPGSFLKGGDSGSAVVENVTSNPKAMGLAFAGSTFFAVANRIKNVLDAFGVTMVSGGASSTGTSSGGGGGGGGQGQGRPASIEQRIAKAAQVKEKFSNQLLSLPEAVGHGVGVAHGNSDEVVIQLFVVEATDRARFAAPGSLDGVRVEVVETGVFKALPFCGETAR